MNEIRLVAPTVVLKPIAPKSEGEVYMSVLDDFLAVSDNFEQQKNTTRSALFSTINKLRDDLADQSKQTITIQRNSDATRRFIQEVVETIRMSVKECVSSRNKCERKMSVKHSNLR